MNRYEFTSNGRMLTRTNKVIAKKSIYSRFYNRLLSF